MKKVKKLSLVFFVALFVAFAFNISVAPSKNLGLPKLSVGAITAKAEVNMGPTPALCIMKHAVVTTGTVVTKK